MFAREIFIDLLCSRESMVGHSTICTSVIIAGNEFMTSIELKCKCYGMMNTIGRNLILSVYQISELGFGQSYLV